MLRSSFFPCPSLPLYIKVLSFVGIFLCWRVRRDVRGHWNFKDSTITVGRNSMSTIKVIWEPVARLRFLRSLHERIHIMNYHSYSQPVKVFFSLTSPLWQSTPIVLMHVYPYDLTDAFSPSWNMPISPFTKIRIIECPKWKTVRDWNVDFIYA